MCPVIKFHVKETHIAKKTNLEFLYNEIFQVVPHTSLVRLQITIITTPFD